MTITEDRKKQSLRKKLTVKVLARIKRVARQIRGFSNLVTARKVLRRST